MKRINSILDDDFAVVERIFAAAGAPELAPTHASTVQVDAEHIGSHLGDVLGGVVVEAAKSQVESEDWLHVLGELDDIENDFIGADGDEDDEAGDNDAVEEVVNRATDAAADAVSSAVVDSAVEKATQSDEEPGECVGELEKRTWLDIVKEAPSEHVDFDALINESLTVQEVAERRVAQTSASLKGVSYQEVRDWQIDFGPASAPAGEEITFTARPQCLFRGEKVIATDTGTPAGTGTRIRAISIGQKIQRPANSISLTRFFAQDCLANGISWDTAQQWATISLTVSFIQACTFDCSVWGKAVL